MKLLLRLQRRRRVLSHSDFNNINVPSAGAYNLTMRFANGSGATSSHNISVATSINLNAGNNTIRFAKGANYAELDSIEVSR